jgi:nonsense-mediated mRNA decay protein 3
VRQKTEHKKTFFFLEQLILKHNAHDKVIKVEEIDDGLDFFYKNKTHAMRLVDFLDGVIPLRIKASK